MGVDKVGKETQELSVINCFANKNLQGDLLSQELMMKTAMQSRMFW